MRRKGLRHALGRDNAHRRATDRFADGLGIVCVILVGLDVRFHKLRRHQPYAVTELTQPARPRVRTTTAFQTDQATRQIGKVRRPLMAPQLPPPYHPARGINPMNLEHLLRRVQPNCGY